jgi:hypothetical protein
VGLDPTRRLRAAKAGPVAGRFSQGLTFGDVHEAMDLIFEILHQLQPAHMRANDCRIRSAELVDTDVRDAIAEAVAEYNSCPECGDEVLAAWDADRGSIIGRLRDEGWNIVYVTAYQSRLRETAPDGASWETVYGTEFDAAVGEYDADPKSIAGFVASKSYYSYLDYE